MRDTPSAIILGNGRMGKIHASVYEERKIPIKGVFDRDSEDQWVGQVDPGDFVSVCSWDDAHARQICQALGRGARVMAEKPLCLNWADLAKIEIALERRGRLGCNLPLGADPLNTLMFERGPNSYHIECDYNWGRARNLTGWRKNCPGYSFVLGGGIHAIDLILRMKRAPIFRVHAFGENVRDEFPGPTMISVHGRFADSGTFRMNVNAAYDGAHFSRATVWDETGDLTIQYGGSDKTARIREFIDNPDPDPSLIFSAHRVCFAILRSLNSGEPQWA